MRPTESPSLYRSAGIAATPGHGSVAVEHIAGRSIITQLRATSPLKLLTPCRAASRAAWIFAATYGGGLVAGDEVNLIIRLAPRAAMILGTQSSTKIYRADAPTGASQSLTAHTGADSLCAILPDPITPFQGAIYSQRQGLNLEASASLLLLDWLSSGRCARGERWSFSRYESRTEITLDGRTILRDALLLDAADGPLAAPCRTGHFNCFATLVLLGPALRETAARLTGEINATPLQRATASILLAASPLAHDAGVIIRIAGIGTEIVGRWLKNQLAPITIELLGDDPWLRKW
jgi:urease accessory protein